MRSIIIILGFLFVLEVRSQNSDITSWDVNLSIENISADSNEIKGYALMFPMSRSVNTYHLKKDKIVSINTFDSLNQIRNVMIKGENHSYIFTTLDGVTTYEKQYFADLETNKYDKSLINEGIPPVNFIEHKMLGPFNCIVNELSMPENIKLKLTSTHDIHSANEFIKMPIDGFKDIGFVLAVEMDLGFLKINMNSSNFSTASVDTSIFSISTEGINETDWLAEMKLMKLMMGSDFPTEMEVEEIPLGDGDNNDLYLKMCEDDVISWCYDSHVLLKPSYDKPTLISYLKTDNADYSALTKQELDHFFLKYNLLTKNELTSIKKNLNKLDNKLDGSRYRDLVNFLLKKKMLETRECKEILITNLAKNNFKAKNVNHPETNSFINGAIDWKTFLSSYQGIYNLQYKKIVKKESDFLNEMKTIINTILPNLSISINENKEIEITKDNLTISYPVQTEYSIIDAQYDDDGNIIKSNNSQYDFENYSKYGLLNLLRQIGADFDLELVFDFINANSVLSHYQYENKYKEIDLFEGDVFLCIDKISSGESSSKDIPFTKTDYHAERDILASIKAFYRSNPGITYIPLYKKEKLFQLINDNRNTFGLDTTFDANLWFANVRNQLFDNLGAFIQSVPNFGVIVSTSISNGMSYNKYGNSYESIFPKLNKLLGDDFKPIDFSIKFDESDAEISFKFMNKDYNVKSSIYKIEDEFLKKAITTLKDNNLYGTKRVYQSIEDFSDMNTKKLFYLSKETYKILTEEFELTLMDYCK
ncbi:MAG: hypothetical protein IPM42_16640 [Saprospiraceae bacterium]|nr:hypothetical protein [Saprospiraceae bacterium]